jgi:hypothetical protein
MNVNKWVVVVMIISSALGVKAQRTEDVLKQYFLEVRSGKYPAIPKQLSSQENAKTTLTNLSQYLADSSSSIRSKALTITQLAGTRVHQQSLRETAVKFLLAGCKDHDSGNAGLAISYLTTFEKQDFSAPAKDSLRILFKHKPAHFEELLKLIGYVGLVDLKEEIRAYTQPGNLQKVRWSALVSLVRMGDAAAGNDMMTRVRKLPVNDDIIYSIFPDLVFSRYPDAFRYMVDVLQRNTTDCLSADAEREIAILCGYRVMEQLAPVIEGYPLKLDESGDLKVKDYAAALQNVRAWLLQHKDFKIRDDKY